LEKLPKSLASSSKGVVVARSLVVGRRGYLPLTIKGDYLLKRPRAKPIIARSIILNEDFQAGATIMLFAD
jgi:hypothetical protein